MSFIASLEKSGYSQENLKAIFEAEKLDTDPKYSKVRDMMERHSVLVKDGLDENYRDAHTWYAIDKAYDIGQAQITSSFMRDLIGDNPSDPEILKKAKSLGLGNLIRDITVKGQTVKALDLPVFFNILVPLVASYVKTRWAKLWTDRNTIPLYKYEASSPTIANHIGCRVITNEIAKDAENMGYRSTERGIILPTLLYGQSWTVAKSDWHKEETTWCGKDSKVETYVKREGIPWDIIHPSKMFYDRSVPVTSINTDTGISWFGHWNVVPYRRLESKKFWNSEKIVRSSNGTGSNWIRSDGWKRYVEFYPCTMKYPSVSDESVPNNRENRWYTHQMGDEGVQVVNFYEKIIPKDCGLYDYDKPVWHLFMYAGSGTMIGCIPFAYTPGAVNVYDHDPNRAVNTSLAHELVPFQDQISNLITQYLLSVQQNLASVVFYNTEQVDVKHIEQLKNLGEKSLRATQFIPFEKKKFDHQGNEVGGAFYPVALPKQNTQELVAGINTMVSAMERMLGFSPQEVGAAASHEQSATEVAVIDTGTSTRIGLTGSFMDDGRSARQKAAYDAWTEYGSREVDVELSGITPAMLKALEKMGFKVEVVPESKMLRITGSRALADIDSFIMARPANDRFPDGKVAIAMLQALQMMMGNPQAVEKFGIDFLIEKFNQILEYAGVPGDWRFDLNQVHPEGQTIQPDQIMQLLQQGIQQNNQQLTKDIQEGIVKPMGDRMAQLDKGQQAAGQGLQQVGQGLQQVAQEQGGIKDAVVTHDQVLQDLRAQVAGIMQTLQSQPQSAQIPAPPEQVNPEAVIAALQGGLVPPAPPA